MTIRSVGVIVPAHDEAALLPACLHALDAATSALTSRDVRCVVVIVLDSCSDGSFAIATQWAARAADRHVIELTARNVGHARAAGAQHAFAEFAASSADEIWIATTDADSEVPPNWLVDQLGFANAGADAFAGTIEIRDWHDLSAHLRDAFVSFYEAHGNGDDHGHVHGANLGVRGDAYLAAGGFAPIPTGEDHALWNALVRRRRYKTRRLSVRTSSRLVARAPDGFSGFLRDFGAASR